MNALLHTSLSATRDLCSPVSATHLLAACTFSDSLCFMIWGDFSPTVESERKSFLAKCVLCTSFTNCYELFQLTEDTFWQICAVVNLVILSAFYKNLSCQINSVFQSNIYSIVCRLLFKNLGMFCEFLESYFLILF